MAHKLLISNSRTGKFENQPPMKPFAVTDAKSLAKSKLSLNNWGLRNKIGFKNPNMMFFLPYNGLSIFLTHWHLFLIGQQ